jgi:hypothetical protein
MKQGIDDDQWQKIEDLLRVKRKLRIPDKGKHDIDKWFEMWKILFPSMPLPEHPCESNLEVPTTSQFL